MVFEALEKLRRDAAADQSTIQCHVRLHSTKKLEPAHVPKQHAYFIPLQLKLHIGTRQGLRATFRAAAVFVPLPDSLSDTESVCQTVVTVVMKFVEMSMPVFSQYFDQVRIH